MISDANLKEFIAQWNTTSGVTILRADQSIKMPSYPYATYKEIATNVEPWVSNIKTRSDFTNIPIKGNNFLIFGVILILAPYSLTAAYVKSLLSDLDNEILNFAVNVCAWRLMVTPSESTETG